MKPRTTTERAKRTERPATAPLHGAAVPPFAWSIGVGLFYGALYALLAPPVSGDKDGSEFTVILALAGASHPSGYPLYTMLGHLFVTILHAAGAGWPWAANLWSALGGGVAILFVHRLSLMLIPLSLPLRRSQRLVASLLPVILFGLNPLWTYETTLAEVYSWHLAWVCSACTFAVWLAQRAGAEEGPGDGKRWSVRAAVWGVICGVGGAHHLTSVLVAAPMTVLLVVALAKRGKLTWKRVGIAGAASLVVLCAYLFVAWRAFSPAPWQWPSLAPSWEGVRGHILATPYTHYLGSFQPSEMQRGLLQAYLYPWVFPAVGLLILAGWLPGKEGRMTLRALAATAVIGLVYAFNYGVPDPASYFLAPLAIGLVGLAPLGARIIAWRQRLRSITWTIGGAFLLAGCFFGAGWIHVAQERNIVLEQFDARVLSMWRSVPYDSAIVLWYSDMHVRLVEYQLLRGEKRDITVMNPVLLLQEHPRRLFIERFGVDPVPETWTTEANDFEERMAHAINAGSHLPVILFDPMKESVRLLRK